MGRARLLDEERTPGIPPEGSPLHTAFLHLVVPVRYDAARHGLPDFENYRLGAKLVGKVFAGGKRSVTFLFSGGYEYQRFFRPDREFHQFDLSFNLGFR